MGGAIGFGKMSATLGLRSYMVNNGVVNQDASRHEPTGFREIIGGPSR
jgi:hypothetical protein